MYVLNCEQNFSPLIFWSGLTVINLARVLLYYSIRICVDRLCGLVIRVPGYRSRSPKFDSRYYQNFWQIVGLERGPLSLVSTTEELLGRQISGSGLENQEYGRRDPSRWPRNTLYSQKLALTLPTSSGRSVGIVRSRTKATESVCFVSVSVCGYETSTLP
jgi:hypothetical protein